MDNLDMDVIRCKAAGFGCRYGDWKWRNPITREIKEDDGTIEKACLCCGKRFKTKNKRKIYCTDICCLHAQQAKKHQKKEGNEQWTR